MTVISVNTVFASCNFTPRRHFLSRHFQSTRQITKFHCQCPTSDGRWVVRASASRLQVFTTRRDRRIDGINSVVGADDVLDAHRVTPTWVVHPVILISQATMHRRDTGRGRLSAAGGFIAAVGMESYGCCPTLPLEINDSRHRVSNRSDTAGGPPCRLPSRLVHDTDRSNKRSFIRRRCTRRS